MAKIATPINWRPPALLLLAVLLLFLRVCGQEFTAYDDNQNIYQNERVVRLSPANLGYFWQKPFAGMYIPLTYNLWSLEAKVASFLPPGAATELNPALFHAVNLLLHLANSLLVYGLLRRFVAHEWAALLGALLFAIHPLQVEAVAWVTGGKDLLSGFFALLALKLYIDSGETAGRGRVLRYLLALLSLAAALLAKPGVVLLPLVAGVIGLGLLEIKGRRLCWELAPWLAVVAPIVFLTTQLQGEGGQQFVPTLWQRLLLGGDSLSFYALKLLAPLQLGFDYGRTPESVLARPAIVWTGLLPYLLAALFFWRARRPYRVAGGIFLLFLLPVLGYIPFSFQTISTVADRYLYLALLGPALAVAWFFGQRPRRLAWGVGVALLLLLGAKSLLQLASWDDTVALSQQGLRVNPRSWTAYGNLGNALAERQREEEALGYYRQALALKADDEKSAFNLALALAGLRQTEAAIAAFRETVRLVEAERFKHPRYKAELLRDAQLNLGELYNARGEKAAAIASYEKALALDPAARGGDANLGVLLAEQGRLAEALACFNRALRQNPDDPGSRLNLGLAHFHRQEYAEASRQFQWLAEAPGVSPAVAAEAHDGLGAVAMAEGRWREASDSFRAALRLVPGDQTARENLARCMAAMAR